MKVKGLKDSICKCYDWAENQGNKHSILWLIWGIYTLIIIVFAWQHEPWYDEYHAWGMVNRMDFSQLWNAMRKEGHFIFWHMCLWPYVKWLGMDWHALYFASIPPMSLACWLLLFKVRFPFLGKLFVVFSAPFFYFYAVIARCYALIPPILMGLASLYQQKKRPVLYCVLLGLLANTHAYIEGLVGILWCLFVYKEVILKWKVQSNEAKRSLLAALLTVILVLFALSQVIGGLVDISSQGYTPPGVGINSPKDWLAIFYEGYQINITEYLHRHMSRFIPNLDLVLTLFCYILLIICVYNTIKRENGKLEFILILLFGLSWQILFATNIYGMKWQRIGLLYFVVVFVLLLCNNMKTKDILVALFILWMLSTQPNYLIIKDLWRPYSTSIYEAKEIQRFIPYNASFYSGVCEGDLINVPNWNGWSVDVQQQLEKECNKDFWLLMYAYDERKNEIWRFGNDGSTVELVYKYWDFELFHIKK